MENNSVLLKRGERFFLNNRLLIQNCLTLTLSVFLAFSVYFIPSSGDFFQLALSPPIILLIIIASAQIIFYWIDHKYSKKIEEFEKEISRLKQENEKISGMHEEIIEDNKRTIHEKLRHLAEKKLNFGSYQNAGNSFETNNERITLYYYDEEEKHFIPVARHSENMAYLTPGRRFYPVDGGVIGLAWNQGHFFKNNYSDPQKYSSKYTKQLEKEHIPKEVAEKFTMKSRLLFGYRLKDTVSKKNFGVIIVESTIKDRYTEEDLLNVFNSYDDVFYQTISRILHNISPYIKAELRESFKTSKKISDNIDTDKLPEKEDLMKDIGKANEMGY